MNADCGLMYIVEWMVFKLSVVSVSPSELSSTLNFSLTHLQFLCEQKQNKPDHWT